MKRHFYDLATGLFVGGFTGQEHDAEANTPSGVGVLTTDDHIDHMGQRVDLATGTLIGHIPASPSDETLAERARETRDAHLSACDWIVVRAVETSAQVPEAWRAYRSALRDVPMQQGFPAEISWPTPPA